MTFLLVFAIGMLLGLMIEVLQVLSGREASLSDLKGDLFGLLTGLSLIELLRIKNTLQYLHKVTCVFLIALFFLSGLSPLIKLSWFYNQRNNAFPVIFDFTEDWSYPFLRLEDVVLVGVVSDEVNVAPPLFRVRFGSDKYAGFSIIETKPDWSGYERLRFNVLSTLSSDRRLVLRVHDATHNQELMDRFNKSLQIQPGLNEFDIALTEIRNAPAARKLDMESIAGVILFSGQQGEAFSLAIGRIYLE